MTSKSTSILAGLAAIFISSSAYAADVYTGDKSLKDDKNYAVTPSLSTWTGPYVGIHGGFGWGDAEVRDTNGGVPVGPFAYDVQGAFGGVTLGYNRQFGQLVAGVELDIGYMDVTGDTKIPSSNPAAHQNLVLDGGLYGVAAGRLGISAGRALFYAKGGVAYFDGEASQTSTNPSFVGVTKPTDAFFGYAYGGGVEYAVAQNISLKFEYLRLDFDTADGSQIRTSDGYSFNNETDLQIDTVKVGLNYRF